MAWSDKVIETPPRPWSRDGLESDSQDAVLQSIEDVIYGFPGGFGFLTPQQQEAVNRACHLAWMRGNHEQPTS